MTPEAIRARFPAALSEDAEPGPVYCYGAHRWAALAEVVALIEGPTGTFQPIPLCGYCHVRHPRASAVIVKAEDWSGSLSSVRVPQQMTLD